jgi:hypothetical protein
MKPIHWLFLLSVALFVSGLGFIVAGARTARQAPAAEKASIPLTPVASVKQLMNGLIDPAAMVVFGSVGTTISAAGTEQKTPKTDAEWEAVGTSAAVLIESGNLMLMGSRAVDGAEWTTQARALMAAGMAAVKATEARDASQLFDAGGAVYEACTNCHQLYSRGS